jgi:hypothetical protein
MKRFFLLSMLLAATLLAQTRLTTSNDRPNANEIVTLEVDARADANTSITWILEAGKGEFVGETLGQSRIRFRPTSTGDEVMVACLIKTPNGDFRPRVKLVVAGEPEIVKKPPDQTPAKNPVQEAKPPHAAPEDLYIDNIENMVPAGWMGDAMEDNGATATLDSGNTMGCYPGRPSCYRLEYKPGKAGWAAFAWQHVTSGTMNWGEDPGRDLSAGGYRSLRIWARGVPSSSGALPKIQFKSGGNVAPKFNNTNRASYNVAGPTVPLTKEGSEFCLDLHGQDLKNTVSPLTIVVTKASNPNGAVAIFDRARFSRTSCEP